MCSYTLFGSCSQTEIRANLIVRICLFFQCVLRRRDGDGETECEFQETQLLVSASSCILLKQAPWLSAAPLCKEAAPVMIDSMKQKLLVPHSLFFISVCSSLFTILFGRIGSVLLSYNRSTSGLASAYLKCFGFINLSLCFNATYVQSRLPVFFFFFSRFHTCWTL